MAGASKNEIIIKLGKTQYRSIDGPTGRMVMGLWERLLIFYGFQTMAKKQNLSIFLIYEKKTQSRNEKRD